MVRKQIKINGHYRKGIPARKIIVTADDLIEAFDTHFEETAYYLDLQKGIVILVSEFDDTDNLKEKIESDMTGRYVYIEPIPSLEGYQQMEDFIAMVSDKNLQEKLLIAISGTGAFHRFKEVLLTHPEERQRWFDFHEKMITEYTKEWISNLNRELEKNPKTKYGDMIVWVQ
jgi:hypothetical protein